MANDLSLALKIKALVEGVKDIDGLTNRVRRLSAEARKQIPDPTVAARAGAKSTQAAFDALGMRSFRQIRREIAATEAGYNRLARSGQLSARELDIAHRQMQSRLKELRAELNGTAQDSGKMGALLSRVGWATAGAAALKFASDATQANREATASFKGLEAVANYTGVGIEKAYGVAARAADDGLMKLSQSSKALQNLLARGYTAEQAEAVIARLKDSAAFNRAAHLSLGEAVETATEGLKNENSVLVDNAGVTKNVSVMWKEYAAQLGKSVEELTQAEKVQAEYNGIMRETEAQAGNAKKAAAGLEGDIAQLGTTTNRTLTALGVAIEPIVSLIMKAGTAILEYFVQPVLIGAQNLIIYLNALGEMLGAVLAGDFSNFGEIWADAERKAADVVERYKTGVIPAAQQAKDAIDAETQARRKAEEAARAQAQADAERAKIAEETAKLAIAKAEAQAKLTADTLQREQRALEDAHAAGLKSYREYYAKRAALQQQEINAEIAATRAALAAEQAALGAKQKEEERLPILARIAGLEAELTILARKRGDVGVQAARDQAAAERELAAELEGMRARLLEAEGKGAEARLAGLEREFNAFMQKFGANLDAEGVAIVEKLFNIEAARARLTDMQAQADLVLQRMATDEQSIDVQREAGLLTETQARERLLELHKQTSDEIRKLIPLMKQLAEASGDPAAIERVRQLEIELEKLGKTGDGTAQRINGAIEEDLVQGLVDVSTKTKDADEAWQEFGLNVLNMLARIAAEKLVASLLGGIGGGAGSAGGLGGILASVLHTGGIAGHGGTSRMISPLAFVGARRLHSGGLASNEVPAILEEEEEVLTRDDPRHSLNGGGVGQSMRMILVDDRSNIGDYMQSSDGERVMIQTLKRNATAVRQILGG